LSKSFSSSIFQRKNTTQGEKKKSAFSSAVLELSTHQMSSSLLILGLTTNPRVFQVPFSRGKTPPRGAKKRVHFPLQF
jgi:hypothetical protein